MRGVTLVAVAILLSACGEREETSLALTLLGLAPSATRVVVSFSAGYVSDVARPITPTEEATLVFERVVVHPNMGVLITVYAAEAVVQSGQVFGATFADRPARWRVTLVPAGQSPTICDGLDNNENGLIDEDDCSG